jgi:hypothetical protein
MELRFCVTLLDSRLQEVQKKADVDVSHYENPDDESIYKKRYR